jgi:hypothetical protein
VPLARPFNLSAFMVKLFTPALKFTASVPFLTSRKETVYILKVKLVHARDVSTERFRFCPGASGFGYKTMSRVQSPGSRVAVGVAVAVPVTVKIGVTVHDRVAVLVGVAVNVTLHTGLGTKDAEAVEDGEGVLDSVCVIVGVMVSVSSGVIVSSGVSVIGGMQEASVTSGETYETMSRFGPPSAVRAIIVMSFLPCSRFTMTAEVFHVSHVPVDGNKSVCACTTPLTETCISLEFTLAFAYLYVRVSACAAPASTKNMTDEPVVLFRFA